MLTADRAQEKYTFYFRKCPCPLMGEWTSALWECENIEYNWEAKRGIESIVRIYNCPFARVSLTES